jgi:hypothetical protein
MNNYIVPSFFVGAEEMRAVFDVTTRAVNQATQDRFVWDYWYIPNQFTYFRTVAIDFFPEDLYRRWRKALETWGKKNLGCAHTIGNWISYYIDGCYQDLHADVPHGPWAYVFSLTQNEHPEFVGGETLLLGKAVLDYWANFSVGVGRGRDQLMQVIPPSFNQLVVFDARIPHGVAHVEGTRRPKNSRIVLHGWFRPPQLMVEGALDLQQVEPAVASVLDRWQRDRTRLGRLVGLFSVRVTVDPPGLVRDACILASTLVSRERSEDAVQEAQSLALTAVRALTLPACSGSTTISFAFTAEDGRLDESEGSAELTDKR